MKESSPLGRPTLVRFLVLAIVLLVGAHLLDGPAFRHFSHPDVYETDWGRMFRVMGYLPLWALAAIALLLCDRRPRPEVKRATWARGSLLLGAAALGGIVAELLKIVVRRERPGDHAGEYFFRPWSEGLLSTGGLGMPSSHALVAFAAAAMLSRLFPRAAVVWWALAIGCGLTRVLAGAHFLSDVVASGIAGYLVAFLLWKLTASRPGWRWFAAGE